MEKVLGQYHILEPLGSGAMGEVYVAEDTKLGRKVAIKMLASEIADSPERRKRLEREAQVVAGLNHPNIVTVYSVEEADGAHFITMELVEGTTLRELFPKIDLKRFFDIAVPLADAVGMAHRQGLIHRDLKPENVMRSDEEVVKVLDFGLAKVADAADESSLSELATRSKTEEGVLIGTIAYMSLSSVASTAASNGSRPRVGALRRCSSPTPTRAISTCTSLNFYRMGTAFSTRSIDGTGRGASRCIPSPHGSGK